MADSTDLDIWRVIGELRGDTFWKTATKPEHMLHTPRGWACDEAALKTAERLFAGPGDPGPGLTPKAGEA